MKSKKNLKKIKIGILLGCLFYFLFTSLINVPLIDIANDKSNNKVKTSLDPIHDLTGTPIYIDNTDPLNDWATFQATYAWCTGDGSAFQPYTISQVLIDGSWHAITIENSNVHFSITWCDLFGSFRGIYLKNVTNGELLYNNCSGGDRSGIYLIDCNDNLISNNDISDNEDYGIESENSNHTEISSNNILNSGIRIYGGFNNMIDNNIISTSGRTGIATWSSSYTTITRNVLNETSLSSNSYSISFYVGYYGYIAHNEMSNSYHGVKLTSSDYTTIYNNTIHVLLGYSSCGIWGIANYNNISENIIEHCGMVGIRFEGDFNDILNNTINTTNEGGILLESGSNLNVQGNVITNVSDEGGIRLESCSNFNVQGNVITNVSEFGINLINSESGDVFDNLLDECGFNVDGDPSFMPNLNLNISNQVNGKPVYFYEGITGLSNGDIINAGQIILYSCDNIDFSNLNLNPCNLGVAFYSCNSTRLSDSDFTYNSHSGIKVKSSNNTIIENIDASNNGKGIIFETCNKASVKDSQITFNRDGGILISNGDNFEISGNQFERNGDNGILFANQSSFNNISNNIARYNEYAGISIDQSSNNLITDNTASYNGVFGILLTHSSNNFVAENTIRNHYASINIGNSQNITIMNNVLEDRIDLVNSINTTFSKNLVSGLPTTYDTAIILNGNSGSLFSENELHWASFKIRGNSRYNYFIGNVLNDPAVAFDFSSSSYNKVINNSMYRAFQCFRESDDCVGNVFIGNYCQEGIDLHLDIIGALIGSIAVAGVAVFMYLKRRKYMR